MFWYIIIPLGIYIAHRFVTILAKDKEELANQAVEEKFQFVVHKLNQVAFNGEGKVIKLSIRSFNLYKEGENQIINFHYSVGILSIVWKYKYFQKEVVHKRNFDDANNLSIFEQNALGERMVEEMVKVVERHKEAVLGITFKDYVLSPIELHVLNLDTSCFENIQDAMNAIKRMADKANCEVVDLKNNFLYQISTFGKDELELLEAQLYLSMLEESRAFGVANSDTASCIMLIWLDEHIPL